MKSVARDAAIGFALACLITAAPLTVRLAFRTIGVGYFACTLASLVATFALSIATVVAVHGVMERHHASPRATAFLALASAIPTMTIAYLVTLFVGRTWPSLPLFDPTEPTTVGFHLATGLADALPLVAAWAGLLYFPAALRRAEARELERDLARKDADLLRLRSHLEPHFVLNSLNTVAGLVVDEPERARELLAILGDVFRDATAFEPRHLVRDEVRWLKRYAAIYEMRHPGLLAIEWKIDPDVEALSCPALILQPVVENAIGHGALRRRGGGRVSVSARATADELVFEVRDDGPGPSAAPRPGAKGLGIVRRRLALEGESEGAFALERDGGWTVARVALRRARAEDDRA
jgi:hypothetical protein